MTKRYILGKRGLDYGVYISKPGVDADTATEDDLLLSINANVSQLIMKGHATSFPQSVILNSSFKPIIMLTTILNTVLPPGTWLYRPDIQQVNTSYSNAVLTGAGPYNMTLNSTRGIAIGYLIFRQEVY